MNFDVYISVAKREPEMLVHSVGEPTTKIIQARTHWPITIEESSCVECAEGQQTATDHFVLPVTNSSTRETEYCAWMCVPTGDKQPWSMIASGMSLEETYAYSEHLASRVSVQPRSLDNG